MTKKEETVLAFLLAKELSLLDDGMKWSAVELMYKSYLSRTKLSKMLGVALIDLDTELKNYEYNSGYN